MVLGRMPVNLEPFAIYSFLPHGAKLACAEAASHGSGDPNSPAVVGLRLAEVL
jgi:hypothetical protein